MPNPILVGYDAHGGDPSPIRFALEAGKFTGAPVVIGSISADHDHAHAEHGFAGGGAEPEGELRQEIDASGLRVDYQILSGGSPPQALHEAAERLDAGLIVVGSGAGGHSGILRRGSTAERLLHGACAPVAVVPADWQPRTGAPVVGVAYTNTIEGRAALSAAIGLARAAGATLRVLSAAKPHGYGDAHGPGSASGPEELTKSEIGGALRAEAEDHVAEVTAGVDDVPIDVDVSVQDPADFVIAASERLNLLICGSRGYGPKKAVLLGGVSRRITAEAQCPVIVLARGVDNLDGLMQVAATGAAGVS